MPSRRWTPLALGAVAALAAACSSLSPPPVAVAQPPAEATPETTTPPPKKPKPCKTLEEQCESEPSTKARIAGTNLVFTPAKGWTYAQAESATLAQASSNGPALSVAQVEVGEAKQEAAKRDTALAALAQELKVTLPKKKVNWKKPDDTKDVAGMKVGLWQVEGAARADKKGPLLIFSSPAREGKALLGLGFVPDDDSTSADAIILQSIGSIAVPEE
jgi:hypothetical protein